MTQPDPANYALAQEQVAAGIWTVDPDLGLIYGTQGKAFCRTNSWGYVQIKFRRRENWRAECAVLAHRVIWEAVHGPVPVGLQINHRNGVKTDNRIINLEAVSGSANVMHAYSTGLSHASRSHARLTEQQALEIYRRCHAGERDIPLAAEYGLTRSAVNNIRNGWSWAHVTGHQAAARYAAVAAQGNDSRQGLRFTSPRRTGTAAAALPARRPVRALRPADELVAAEHSPPAH